MLLVSQLLSWWYGAGWRRRAQKISDRLAGTMDYFSMDLLLKTLFSPYRQISAGSVDGSLEVKMRALIDKLFSRLIGAFIRLILLVIGIITVIFQALFGLVALILWGLTPLIPFVGLALTIVGWTP